MACVFLTDKMWVICPAIVGLMWPGRAHSIFSLSFILDHSPLFLHKSNKSGKVLIQPPTLSYKHFFPICEGPGVRIRLLLASAMFCSCWLVCFDWIYSSCESYRCIFLQRADHKPPSLQTVALVWSYYWDKRCLFSLFHSCPLHTHAHAHPSFFFFTAVCLQAKWSYPGVRGPGLSQINTPHARVYNTVHSNVDKCSSSQNFWFKAVVASQLHLLRGHSPWQSSGLFW